MSAALVTSDKENLKLNRFYVWFATAVCRWLDIALYKAMIRIGKAIALDSLQPIDSLVKFSSSAVDTVTVFYQVTLRFPRQPSKCPSPSRLQRLYDHFPISSFSHKDKNLLGTTRLAGYGRSAHIRYQDH